MSQKYSTAELTKRWLKFINKNAGWMDGFFEGRMKSNFMDYSQQLKTAFKQN